jgi:succinate dehydrogenase / fumarate reductase cytochrome b subunit
MADKQTVNPALRPRPVSPHLQIYRWPVTMATSIVHRVTGVGLSLAAIILAWWLLSAALGPGTYDVFTDVAGHWFGQLVLFGITWALVYHFLNGIRHLMWDFGYGFAVPTAASNSIIVISLSVVVTIVVWILGYWVKGDLAL